MYLLDTNVVSELRKTRAGRGDANVLAWAANCDGAAMFISAITIEELEIGVLSLARRDVAHARLLRQWLDTQVSVFFTNRILAVDAAVARRSAQLHVPDRRPYRDALIAATALVHGFTVVTRNVGDFAPTGVRVLDPWRGQT